MTVPSNSGGQTGDRVIRHHLVDRIYHWTMAASVLTLMGTAFIPIMGWWKFEWVMIHWIAGFVLTFAVIIHIVRALFWQDLSSMMMWPRDIMDALRSVARFLGSKAPAPALPGKYQLLQKAYHWGIALVIFAVIVTGAMMFAKIDTPWWRRNPYIWGMTDRDWGMVYAVHGLAAMAAISLVLIHIYFAIRPEKLWITRSMLRGWITRKEYRDHHDPSRWAVDGASPAPAGQRQAAE